MIAETFKQATYAVIEGTKEYDEILGLVHIASTKGLGEIEIKMKDYPDFNSTWQKVFRSHGFGVHWGSDYWTISWM